MESPTLSPTHSRKGSQAYRELDDNGEETKVGSPVTEINMAAVLSCVWKSSDSMAVCCLAVC